jgi:hypothetical protein
MTTVIGTVPAGTKIVKLAESADWRDHPARVLLMEYSDGTTWWLHINGHKESVERPSQQA